MTDIAALDARIRKLEHELGIQQDIPDQPDALRSAFPNWLYMAAAKSRVVLVLDALNQLEDRDGAPDLVWLPPVLPENVRLIVSTLPSRPLDEIQKRNWSTLKVELLSTDERRKLIAEYLAQHVKALNAARVELIAAAPSSANPLYLRVLLDELRLVRTHEELEERIGDYRKAESPYALYEKVIARWEQDYEGESDLVGDTLSLLWADNYIAAVGLLQTNAANVILTNGFPANSSNPISWFVDFADFHAYPYSWYEETIETDVSALGFLWSFERGGWFSQAPGEGSVYVQAFNNSQWNLTATNWTYGTNLLNARFQAYRNGLAYSLTHKMPSQLAVNGNGSAEYVADPFPAVENLYDSFIMSLLTTPANTSPISQIKARPFGLSASDESGSTNVPAYAWMPLVVPANAVSLSFDYIIQGDWQSDSLAAAFNGTNVLLIAGNVIQTNVMFSSGSIDVAAFAGQTNELFIGIVGGTSTNAQLTVENLVFSISSPPLLQAQPSGTNLMLSWPMSSQNFSLQTTTNLTDPNSWQTLTNVPAIVNLQNTITNQIIGSQGFYRLIQSQ